MAWEEKMQDKNSRGGSHDLPAREHLLRWLRIGAHYHVIMCKSSSIARCAVELQALGRYLERREDPGTGIESSPQAWNSDIPARQYYECMSGSILAILMQRQQN